MDINIEDLYREIQFLKEENLKLKEYIKSQKNQATYPKENVDPDKKEKTHVEQKLKRTSPGEDWSNLPGIQSDYTSAGLFLYSVFCIISAK